MATPREKFDIGKVREIVTDFRWHDILLHEKYVINFSCSKEDEEKARDFLNKLYESAQGLEQFNKDWYSSKEYLESKGMLAAHSQDEIEGKSNDKILDISKVQITDAVNNFFDKDVRDQETKSVAESLLSPGEKQRTFEVGSEGFTELEETDVFKQKAEHLSKLAKDYPKTFGQISIKSITVEIQSSGAIDLKYALW